MNRHEKSDSTRQEGSLLFVAIKVGSLLIAKLRRDKTGNVKNAMERYSPMSGWTSVIVWMNGQMSDSTVNMDLSRSRALIAEFYQMPLSE